MVDDNYGSQHEEMTSEVKDAPGSPSVHHILYICAESSHCVP